MKFKETLDEVQYNILGLNEIEVRKRIGLAKIKTAKDHNASRNAKNNWRRNKAKMKKGIAKWSKSTAGKRFHRALGRFNALRESVTEFTESVSGSTGQYNRDLLPGMNYTSLTMTQVNDALLGLSSIETHLYLELQYYEADAEAMVQFLELIDAFVKDSSVLKVELLSAYVSGNLETENFNLLTDMIQFFQDPTAYIYAKRTLAGMRNDQDDEMFRAMLQAVQKTDPLAPSNETYDELDRVFEHSIVEKRS